MGAACELIKQIMDPHIKEYCGLLEKLVWEPTVSGSPIHINLRTNDTPLLDMMEGVVRQHLQLEEERKKSNNEGVG
jgi:hypothetical protein